MNLRFPYRTIRQSDRCESFALSPPPFAVELTKTRKFANRSANRKRFDFCDLAPDLEEHSCGF